jgi:ApaG protein
MQDYASTTGSITVTARPVYLDGRSNLLAKKFVFAYFITIENHGSEQVQLLRRHWQIRDGNGDMLEVEGEGVIGHQPVIPPGGRHEYSSYSVLRTFEGSMEGTFLMKRPDGVQFSVAIPRFVLRASAN